MSTFDQIGPGGTPSYAKPVAVLSTDSVMAQLSRGDIPMNTVVQLGGAVGANCFGGSRPSETVARMMSVGHIVPSLPLNSQPSTPPANGVSSKGTNVMSQCVASLSAGVLTVTGLSGLPALAVGAQLLGPTGWPQGLSIVSLGSGTGGLGTYNVSCPSLPTNQINAPSAVAVVSVGAGG